MATLEHIIDLCRTLAAGRRDLSQALAIAEAELQAVREGHLTEIRPLVATVAAIHDELVAAIEASPGLFTRPRSQVLHGIKVGYAKAKGKVSWADAGQVVRLIRKHLPDQADVLIATKETPVKAALSGLVASDLKRIGVTISESGDRVIVIPQDGEIDKLAAALLGDPATGDDVASSSEEAA